MASKTRHEPWHLEIIFVISILLRLGSAIPTQDDSPGKGLEHIYVDPSTTRENFDQLTTKWRIGFLNPELGKLNGSQPSSLIFDLKASNSSSNTNLRTWKFNVTLIFHEYYHDYLVVVCDTNGGTFTIDDFVSLPVPIDTDWKDNIAYQNWCHHVDPILTPVYEFSGPAMVEVVRRDRFGHIPERFHLKSKDVFTNVLFNFTYELRLRDEAGVVREFSRLNTSFFDPVGLTNGQPCSSNGIPILRKIYSSSYKFSCDCQQGTYGDRCQWGAMCTQNKSEEVCSYQGFCRAKIGFDYEDKICQCYDEFHGEECQYPNFNYYDSDLVFRYETDNDSSPLSKELLELKIKSELPCDHVMQDKDLANQLIINERTVTLPHDSYDTFNRGANRCVPSKCPQIFEKSSLNDSAILNWTQINIRPPPLIQNFISVPDGNVLNLCCSTCSKNNFQFYFFKNQLPINVEPIRPMQKCEWKEGDLSVTCSNDTALEVCVSITNYSENDDGGIYRCKVVESSNQSSESKYLKVESKKDDFRLEVESNSSVVMTGQNARVNCWLDGLSSRLPNINVTWNVSDKLNYGNYSYFPLDTRGSFILISNITADIKVTCTIQNISLAKDVFYLSNYSDIRVVEETSTLCPSETFLNINWPQEMNHRTLELKCPSSYIGHCTRYCSLEGELKKPGWRWPDCSSCERKKIKNIFMNVTSYQKGFLSYLPNPLNLFPELIEELKLGNEGVILPGETGSIIRRVNEVILDPKLLPEVDAFYSLINLMISTSNSLHKKDLNHLQTLLKAYPSHLDFKSCISKKVTYKNVAVFMQIQSKTEIFNVTLRLKEDPLLESSSLTNRNHHFKMNANPSNSILLRLTEISVSVNGGNSKKRVVTILRRPELLLPYFRRIHDQENYDLKLTHEQHFGEVTSPLVQIDVFGEQLPRDETFQKLKAVVTFSPCQIKKSSLRKITCGRLNTVSLTWNRTSCEFLTRGGRCFCSCDNIEGWIGLVAFESKVNASASSSEMYQPNISVAISCGSSLVILLVAAIFVVVRGALFSSGIFPSLLEIVALIIINAVFVYCSVRSIAELERMVVLMIVSGCLVLVIGISVSHQADILQKCGITERFPPQCSTQNHQTPSFLLLLVSTLVAVMLGGTIWIMARVQKIRLYHAWLPQSDDSSLSFVVLSYICSLLVLQCLLAFVNCRKVKQIKYRNRNWSSEPLRAELKTRCILGFLEMVFILSSCFQEKSPGKFIFSVATVTLSVTFFTYYAYNVFSCCYWQRSSASRISTSKDEIGQTEKQKLQVKSRFFWKGFFCPSSGVYLGVANTETSQLPHDESMDLDQQVEPICAFNCQQSATNAEVSSSNQVSGSSDGQRGHISTNHSSEQGSSGQEGPECVVTQADIEFDGTITVYDNQCQHWHCPPACLSNHQVNRLLGIPNGEGGSCRSHGRYVNMDRKTIEMEMIKPANGNCHGVKAPDNYVNASESRKVNGNCVSEPSTPKHSQLNSKPAGTPMDKLFASRSQNASPHIARIVGSSRTKSANAISAPLTEKKAGIIHQFSSKLRLIKNRTRGSRHFDSGKFADSAFDIERAELINASANQSPIKTDVDNRSLLRVDHSLHHKRKLSL